MQFSNAISDSEVKGDEVNENKGKPAISKTMIKKWQRILNILAQTLDVPAALIMKVYSREIEVFLSSETAGNPYKHGERAKLNTGLYCETVMASRQKLLVPDARMDPVWDHNPDVELNMFYYLGYPLMWPDGVIFGTICVLDDHNNSKATAFTALMSEFREMVQADLALLLKEQELQEYNKQLEKFNEIMINRENRMIEIKEEVNALCRKSGQNIRYPEIWKTNVPHSGKSA